MAHVKKSPLRPTLAHVSNITCTMYNPPSNAHFSKSTVGTHPSMFMCQKVPSRPTQALLVSQRVPLRLTLALYQKEPLRPNLVLFMFQPHPTFVKKSKKGTYFSYIQYSTFNTLTLFNFSHLWLEKIVE